MSNSLKSQNSEQSDSKKKNGKDQKTGPAMSRKGG